jgi:A/G-specific adenine glycosylase
MDNFDLSILKWYRQNKRNLPWRNTNNPYFIWLSEIILQQTRVDQGMDYYLKFINNFPTIQHLANADEQTILSNWQGLGYYSRARNLHATAKEITFKHNGNFPNKYEEILKLKGIGPYSSYFILFI